ncbi:MAG: Obg family GTPase CgtA, partial [Streptosporangiales bacterium]|nr:Obg family GTPase CgtA [Streptosporangiales bacterium]
ERCHALVHVLDCATPEPGRDPVTDLDTIERELAAYRTDGIPLADRPVLVVLNKVDVPESRELADLAAPELRERGYRVIECSAATHEGLRELAFAMAGLVRDARAALPRVEPTRTVLRPHAIGAEPFGVALEDGVYVVRGAQPERWVRQTDFGNDEAVGYLADRLNRLGVEKKLVELGATPGCDVRIGADKDAVEFAWEPTLDAAADVLGPRGGDVRIADQGRRRRTETD